MPLALTYRRPCKFPDTWTSVDYWPKCSVVLIHFSKSTFLKKNLFRINLSYPPSLILLWRLVYNWITDIIKSFKVIFNKFNRLIIVVNFGKIKLKIISFWWLLRTLLKNFQATDHRHILTLLRTPFTPCLLHNGHPQMFLGISKHSFNIFNLSFLQMLLEYFLHIKVIITIMIENNIIKILQYLFLLLLLLFLIMKLRELISHAHQLILKLMRLQKYTAFLIIKPFNLHF